MKKTAGILLYRWDNGAPEFMLVHPGGPFWAKKDQEAWSIPKGEFEDPEQAEHAARREFHEETGMTVEGNLTPLTPTKTSNKIIYPFFIQADFDINTLRSNTFDMEWPPKSGRQGSFPEIDRAEWFPYETALKKINKFQRSIVQETFDRIKSE